MRWPPAGVFARDMRPIARQPAKFADGRSDVDGLLDYHAVREPAPAETASTTRSGPKR